MHCVPCQPKSGTTFAVSAVYRRRHHCWTHQDRHRLGRRKSWAHTAWMTPHCKPRIPVGRHRQTAVRIQRLVGVHQRLTSEEASIRCSEYCNFAPADRFVWRTVQSRQRTAVRCCLFLADVNYVTSATCYRNSVCRLSSVTLVHPTQAVELFGNFLYHTIAQGLYFCGAKNRWWGTPLPPWNLRSK